MFCWPWRDLGEVTYRLAGVIRGGKGDREAGRDRDWLVILWLSLG